jgi:hypothetical protein
MESQHRQDGALLRSSKRDVIAVEAKLDQAEKADFHGEPVQVRVQTSLIALAVPRYYRRFTVLDR